MLLILAPVKLLISAPVYPNSHENLSGSEIGEDLEMESETSRRIALAMKTISPGALKANIPFCVESDVPIYVIVYGSSSIDEQISNAATFTGYRDTPCNGSIAECNKEEEILMESDISRRFLEQKYISPGALKPDQPVCEGANGESYSNAGNCLPPSSNPHDRGCSKYYRCRS
ncbi:hypothetical protein FEM48_Zijuj07G0051300 [Ziziphus jujuba var. spinosa]|uniref:Protein RALF-like 32 n=1 Tax=Ziziphus jujuba var. spinosa TaxID=714518 RepID=A0A978V2M6_ZIZJJ|nr:hypothetical protein FEM48_Zijuj07G0051300 [Ziziphus jujuba var. spinosa]